MGYILWNLWRMDLVTMPASGRALQCRQAGEHCLSEQADEALPSWAGRRALLAGGRERHA